MKSRLAPPRLVHSLARGQSPQHSYACAPISCLTTGRAPAEARRELMILSVRWLVCHQRRRIIARLGKMSIAAVKVLVYGLPRRREESRGPPGIGQRHNDDAAGDYLSPGKLLFSEQKLAVYATGHKVIQIA
jgi:hypothetical protein